MSTTDTNHELENAEPGETAETDRGAGTVLAAADNREELVERVEELVDSYRLYSYGDDGGPDCLVGVYDTLDEAREKMRSISYDMDPELFFYVKQDDEVVMGDPATWGTGR